MSAAAGELGVDLAILIGLTALGWIIVALTRPDTDKLVIIAVAYPIGAALFTWVMYLASLAGSPVEARRMLAVYLGMMILVIVLYFRRRAASRPERESSSSPTSSSLARALAFVAALGLSVFAAWLAVIRSYSTWDAMAIWGVKGFAIAKQGTILAAAEWGSHGLAYPLNIPLQIAIFRLLTYDILPGSKLIFPVYYLALVLGTFGLLERSRGWRRAGMAGLVIASVPVLFEHATIGYANLPFTAYLVLGTIFHVRWRTSADHGDAWLSGLLWAGAAWTRAEGLFLVPLIFLGILAAGRIQGDGRIKLGWYAAPFLVVAGSWQVVAASNPATSSFLRAVPKTLQAWSHFDFHASAIYWIFRFTSRQGIEPTVWGAVLPLVIVTFALAGRGLWTSSGRSPLPMLIGATLAVGLWCVGYFYVSSYTASIKYLLGTSVNRVFMPFWVLLLMAALFVDGQWFESNQHAEAG